MCNKVIAISGYSGSGKTTVSEYLMKLREDIIYFDFGYLFRPLTFYLFHDLGLNELEVRELLNNNMLFNNIKFSYIIENNVVKIGINDKYYTYEELFSLKMNMDTVVVGSIVGDSLTDVLCGIVDELK